MDHEEAIIIREMKLLMKLLPEGIYRYLRYHGFVHYGRATIMKKDWKNFRIIVKYSQKESEWTISVEQLGNVLWQGIDVNFPFLAKQCNRKFRNMAWPDV